VDLRKFPGGPGDYRLEGKWDWGAYRVAGMIRLHKLEDLSAARLTPESMDRLIAASGPVSIELTGTDFLFVDKAWLHRAESSRQVPVDLPAERAAPADRVKLDLDTDGLRPGAYLLALSRIDGTIADVPVRLLPPPPKVAGGLRVNLGDREQTITLAGTGLDRISSLEIASASVIRLMPANEEGTRRQAAVRLLAEAKPGDRLTGLAKVEGMNQVLRRVPGSLRRRLPCRATLALPPARARSRRDRGSASLCVWSLPMRNQS
jgi:hypothetical protein